MKNSYRIIETIDEVHSIVEYCKQTRYCSFDIETNGRPYYEDDSFITILGISFQVGNSYIIPLKHNDSKFKEDYLKILQIIARGILENPDIVKIAYNIQFEINWMRKYGIEVKGRLFDTMLAKYLLNEERPNDLGYVSGLIFPESAGFKDETEKLARKFGWANIPLKELCDRNALDTDLTLRLMLYFEPKLIGLGLYQLYRNLIMMMARNLSETSFGGIPIDMGYLKDLDEKYIKDLTQLKEAMLSLPRFKRYDISRIRKIKKGLIETISKEIEELEKDPKKNARVIQNRKTKLNQYYEGKFLTKKDQGLMAPFNIQSTKQLIDFFFIAKKGLRLKVIAYTMDKKTKEFSKNPSVAEDTLLKLKNVDKSMFIDKLLQYNKKEHLHSTYIKGILERTSTNGKIHTSFLVHGTVTGRLSSINPNLQNIPRGCIDYNTQLITNKGLITIGDYIPNTPGKFINGEPLKVLTHTGEYKEVTHWINKGLQEMVEIKFDNGSTLICTLAHKLLTMGNGWQTVENIINKGYECRSFEIKERNA